MEWLLMLLIFNSVMNVQKLPVERFRKDPRLEFPNYDGLEWAANKIKWDSPYDTVSVPTGMFKDQDDCNKNPVSISVSIFNKLGLAMPHRRNPA